MTLPNDEVLELLQDRFVLGARNIERDRHVGLSHGYKPDQSAVGTTNGAGGRNVQLIVLAADGVVLHALPGFWHAEDLLRELRFALQLHDLHDRQDLAATEKARLFRAMHRAFAHRLPADTVARSRWQGFDESEERERAKRERRDTFVYEGDAPTTIKPVCQLVHERLETRPFRRLEEFGMEAFVDYGRAYYDNNSGDKGRSFAKAEAANKKRAQELAKLRKSGEEPRSR